MASAMWSVFPFLPLPCTEQQSFVPICWSTDPGRDYYAGRWRVGGTGMVAFYIADLDGSGFDPPSRLPMAYKKSWGNEDIALTTALETSGWCYSA